MYSLLSSDLCKRLFNICTYSFVCIHYYILFGLIHSQKRKLKQGKPKKIGKKKREEDMLAKKEAGEAKKRFMLLLINLALLLHYFFTTSFRNKLFLKCAHFLLFSLIWFLSQYPTKQIICKEEEKQETAKYR